MTRTGLSCVLLCLLVGGHAFTHRVSQSYGQEPVPRALLFVSLSIPEASLRAYGRDIQTIGGALVFRGFRPGESMGEFSQRIQKTFPKPVPLLLDPLLFRKFNVTDVPTFVLTEESTSDQVSGHLTLESFLEVIAQEGELADLALRLKETLSP